MNHKCSFSKHLEKSHFSYFTAVVFSVYLLPFLLILRGTSAAVAEAVANFCVPEGDASGSPSKQASSIHCLWMICMDCVLQVWLERSKLFLHFSMRSLLLYKEEKGGPLGCFLPALSESSADLLFIFICWESTTSVLSVCIWSGKKAFRSTWPSAARCDKPVPVTIRI